MVDLRSDTVTLPTRGDARGDGRGPGRRRPVRRGPERQPPAGARRRAARQGGGAVRPDGHDGQPAPAEALLLARRRRRGRRARATPCGTRPARRPPTRGSSSPRPARGGLFTARRAAGGDEAARTPAVPADHARRGRGHPQPDGRPGLGARGAGGRRARRAREHGAASYLDGARLLNAAAARGEDPAALAAPFDLVVDRALEGARLPGRLGARRQRARTSTALVRYRRMLGGAMRQAGVLAAAGLYALDHHVERLADGPCQRARHRRAPRRVDGVGLDLDRLETNIVVFRLADGAPDAADRRRAARASAACS